jgi:hypothetical protein
MTTPDWLAAGKIAANELPTHVERLAQLDLKLLDG